MNTNTIPVELSRKELLEIQNRLAPNSKVLTKIAEAIANYESTEEDEEYEDDSDVGFGKFNLHGED